MSGRRKWSEIKHKSNSVQQPGNEGKTSPFCDPIPCYICNEPEDKPGKWYCSRPHLVESCPCCGKQVLPD